MASLFDQRTCRCCGRSVMKDEREEIDTYYERGLDVCTSCILHFKRRSCLDFEVEDSNDTTMPESESDKRRSLMASFWE